MRRITLISILVLLLFQSAVAFTVQRAEPAFWWSGMKNPELQIMMYGKDIADAKVSLTGTEARLTSVVRPESNNYLFLYLDLKDAKPGKFDIVFTEGKKKHTFSYELRQRTVDPATRKGFDASDVLYLIMPDRFANGNPGNDNTPVNIPSPMDRSNHSGRHGGDLAGIEQHLDYVEDLGVTAIWLNPVLENDMPGGSYHGYATTDYYKVDPRFGSNEEYVQLIDKTHQRGMKVVMDMIFNHCGSEHPWMKDSPSKDWFNMPDNYVQTSYRLTPHFDPYVSDYDKKMTVDAWFVESMPDLNQRNPHLAKYLIQNSIWWIEYSGIDGIRMDTHPYADSDMMSDWCKAVYAEYPNYNIVGECWYENEGGVAFWQKDSRLNQNGNSNLKTVMDFPLMRIANKAFHSETTPWEGLNAVYDHLALDYMLADPSHVLVFLDNHDTDRFLREMPQNLDIFKQAMTFLLTTRGIPQIYYGTEILMNGTKARSDGDIRLDFPGGWPNDSVNAFDPAGRTPLQQQAFDITRQLLKWRKGNEVVAKGTLKHFMPTNGVYVYERSYNGKSVLVLLNGTSKTYDLDLTRYAEILPQDKSARNALTGQPVSLNAPSLALSPRETLILEY